MSLRFGPLQDLRYGLRVLQSLSGRYERECPLCGYRGRFSAFGIPPRPDARCRGCGSMERHRLFALWLHANEGLLRGRRVLHFAPEAILRKLITPISASYIGADLNPQPPDVALNLEQIELADASQDAILCNHVLEHVDHHRALREMHRVLAPGGVALLTFPIIEGWAQTYENPAVTSAHDRLLHFGQEDHIKFFGADVRQHIVDAGFELEEFTAVEPFVHRHALLRGGKLFIGRKPQR
ncbi:class I SAM-dependent methyltransferase [Rivibacter subsaxonicus]|uniref:Methyltransferase family protein n=1 Tax=Rivibacter subsaxonicus TaxID=457575 RepID=A0A4V2FUJ7_9BURK|nr:class I SAM-dependent methyltransferase [Rivibacter subsaxonicus]RZU02306.1 methyltransferase family protein [Rivibacter subsaxonicus]